MKKTVLFLGLVLFVFSGLLLAKPQTKCPVMGENINKGVYTDYNGFRIYFCCNHCIKDFNKDPEKYIKKMTEEKIELEKAPAPKGQTQPATESKKEESPKVKSEIKEN